ncbi:MAG: hypothetical protein AMS15_06610 [Planctomycetes bacterium DG_23]|nr:MAG: hypothetical protein AMS15_06610 [Planctomycetes bacterium DG_23]
MSDLKDLKFVQEGIREGRPWWVVETPHYLLMFDEASRKIMAPRKFARQAERRIREIARLLGLKKDKQTKRYFDGPSIPYFIHDPAVCKWGSGHPGGLDVPASMGQAGLRHEEAHKTLERAGGAPPPLFNEGFASYAASPKSNQNHRVVLSALESATLPSLPQIADYKSFWKKWKALGRNRSRMYEQAGSFVAFLFGRFGRRRFIAFSKNVSYTDSNAKVVRVFREVYGMSLGEAEAQWKSYLLRKRSQLRPRSRRKKRS